MAPPTRTKDKATQEQDATQNRRLRTKKMLMPQTEAAAASQRATKLTLPSSRLNVHKQANPWGKISKKGATSFRYAYAQGTIPCRINHGGIKSSLLWDEQPATLSYDPLLITCFEGFAEDQHPYVFIARTAAFDLLNAPGAAEKTLPLLPKLIAALSGPLRSSKLDEFQIALKALRSLSHLATTDLNTYVPKLALLIAAGTRRFKNKCKTDIASTLGDLVDNGGDEAYKSIKAKLPTYS